MKRTYSRLFALVLAAVMLVSLLPASALEIHDETPAAGGQADLLAAGELTIPGYTQVTALNQIKADREYLIVAKAPAVGTTPETFYALYLNADGVDKGPGAKGHPECTATLTVSGETVTAVKTADTSTALLMDDLHVTITNTSGGYTITNSTHALRLHSNNMFIAAADAPALPLAFTGDGRFAVTGSASSRYLTFNVNGATSAQTHFPDLSTGFCGWNDPQTGTNYYIPIYLFIEGELPVDLGINLTQMLSGDKIDTAAGVPAANEDPDGQNSWVFTGGRAAQGSFADVKGARTYAGHFEEYVRYTQTKTLQTGGESTSPYLQRHVINAAYEGQTLAQIVSTFDTRIAPLKPRAVSYLVDEGGSSEANFAANLGLLIDKALALQSNTGMLVIETLSAADKTAVDAVVGALPNDKKVNVLPVSFSLTAAQKTGGYPNASGHLEMAKKLADAVAGSTVSTAANWPYGVISASVMATDFPNKTSLDHAHGYVNPTTLSAAQSAIKTKVQDTATPMTWLFMGDSITHGAAWTGGYDTLAQLFEKFVKDDLDRTQDIVINAGSSGATTGSTVSDLNRRLVKYSPDVVVLMLGTNDAASNVSENTYKTNIRTLLDKIIAKGATPVLRTPPPGSRDVSAYAQYLRDVVEESAYAGNVVLVDQYELWTDNNWSAVFSRNDLHPDEAGHLWFAHQLIKELALWNDSYDICRLEYVELKEPGKIELPGYTQLTDMSQLDETKGYLIVSQDAEGNLYALYPSADGETLGAGALPSPGGENEGARAAKLTVSGETVSAVWMKDNSPQNMEKLLFTIKAGSGGKYIFTAFNGRHLNMTDKMFTEGTAELTVTARGTAALNAFRIQNGRRSLDFSKTGDPDAFNGSQYGTDFWCPNDNIKMRTYLFASTVEVPTAKDGIEALLEEVKGLTQTEYTGASWTALQAAKTAAQAVLDAAGADDTGDEAKYVTARDNLRDAIDHMSKKPTPPTVPNGATKITDWKTMVPSGGTSQNEPFKSGTGGSNKFRIPAIITLQHQSDESKNGRLLSAIDARWNHTGDACGLDTIVSYSDDTGANWNYNFPNYFGDSINAYAQYGTAFIDPVLLEGPDGTVYLMTDIWPGGIALNTAPNGPANSTGCEVIDGTKRLVLYADAPNRYATTYDYYVGDFVGTGDKYAPVMEPNANGDDFFSGYYIDEYYYLYHTSDFSAKNPANDKIYCQRLGSSEWVQQNVFFYNATLHVRDASYLWIVTSKDGGETWGTPKMINAARTDTERFYGVGPGAGLCMEDGTLLLPIYIWPSELAGFIYSKDNGETWAPSPNFATTSSDATSESCLVQIDATTVRHFYRESWKRQSTPVAYTDHTWDSESNTWTTGSIVRIDGVNHYGACQVSAIKYSKKVDGKDMILYSTPINGSGRSQGVIYAFLVNNDAGHTMTLYNTYAVNGNLAYAYSSLTETADGNIALLYESTSDAVIFKIIPITDLVPDLSVTGYTGNYNGTARSVTVTANPDTATLQYSTNGGADWVETKPTFTNVGTYTVTVKATWGSVVKEASATVTIRQVTPTLSITSDLGTALEAGDEPTFTISGVPSEGTVTLTCSDHGQITLNKQTNGTYTGSHGVAEGQHTFTASYTDPNGNYANASATYRVTVAPAEFGLRVNDYTGVYDGQPHSITLTAAEGVTLAYCATENGDYTDTKPEYTNAGSYTIYYQATKSGETVSGSANVTITKATPTLAILCGNEDHGETHSISTADLPFTLTITGVPAEDQGHFTLTTFNDAVRNLTHNSDGTWTAAPHIPPITRTYHFIATFDPTVDQAGNEIENPNYEPATDEFTVTVSRPADEVIDFNFDFADGVTTPVDGISTKGAFEVLYDGSYHGVLPALTYDKNLDLTYHVSEEDAEIGTESWSDTEPKFRQPGEYTVSVMASPTTSPVAKVLTVVLHIVERETPTAITITPSAEEFEGGGKLTLTVKGAPDAGILTVTCAQGLRVTEDARGTYSVTLPNTTQNYTFTADYEGAGSYLPSHASCSVSVTATASASNPAVPVISNKPNEDGTTTTTVTGPDGTVTETTEKPDGTTEIVETKPDGTVTESVEKPDGSKETVETKPDGTVTETKIDAEGAKVEKVTDPEENVTITATDPEGEVVAEVKVPALIPESEKRFEDVPEGHWADEAIHQLAAIEVVNGVTDTTYSPVAPLKRGDLAVVLHRLSNKPASGDLSFEDVLDSKYYAEGVAWAAKVGVVEGFSEEEFQPETVITREQLALMLMRYAKLLGISTDADAEVLEAYADGGKTSSWAVDGVAWCVKAGIIQGMDATTLSPNTNVTRAQVAVMLQRFIDLMK